VVILSLVLFLALPLSTLIMVDTMTMKEEVKYEIRQMKNLEQQLKKQKESKDE